MGQKTTTGRETALEVLTACRRLEAWSDSALRAACKRGGLDRREAALAARLTYGVLQNRALLDYYLDQYLSQPMEQLEPFVRDVLRLGACQILLLDRVPDSAAVSETVELVKKRRRRAAGLVNAVLRKLSQHKDDLPAIAEKDEAAYLSIRYSHPKWLVERLLQLLGREEAEAFLNGNNQPSTTTIHLNPLRCRREELEASFRDLGATLTPHLWLPDCWDLTGGGSLEGQAAFQEGWFQVQDAAARLAVLAAGPRPGDRVLDVCAAPGGKTFAMAAVMGDQGAITACDIHQHKLELIQRGAKRLGIGCVDTALIDGREARPEWDGRFDLVFCDVPCSGLGVIRKKPEIRYREPSAIAPLPGIQEAILANASRYVRPGGILLYATCTILPEENQNVTEDFLLRHRDFTKEPFTLPGPAGETDGSLTLWPQRHGTDGFYLCRMKRREEDA